MSVNFSDTKFVEINGTEYPVEKIKQVMMQSMHDSYDHIVRFLLEEGETQEHYETVDYSEGLLLTNHLLGNKKFFKVDNNVFNAGLVKNVVSDYFSKQFRLEFVDKSFQQLSYPTSAKAKEKFEDIKSRQFGE